MKVLLTAINAKYIHTNLAILYLKEYAKEYEEHVEIMELTINNEIDHMLREIYKKKPDIIAFSCYIWNIGIIYDLARELHKILPKTKIWLGGPEVSYDAKERLHDTNFIDGIMIGEGEETFKELLSYYIEDRIELKKIKGITFRKTAYKDVSCEVDKEVNSDEIVDDNLDEVVETKFRDIMNLSSVLFPYKNMEQFKNKIIYYETSRGCPYSCSYCLSSIDKKVRLRDLELVKKELAIFLENKVPQVKFVDRTFNCNRKHALEIWKFIKENDNGITNFHFEISADILTTEELSLMATLRKGLIQLEIGVQSTNPKTIEAINRKMDFQKLSGIVHRINEGNNIHQHLDLIVGLPYEDYETFQRSFNDVYALRPNQLQIGFLKILKGSDMYHYSKKNTIVYKDKAPYEVLYTNWISYEEVLKLKEVEEMVEVYYNSGQFIYTIEYLEHFFDTPFELYRRLGEYYEEKKLSNISHARMSRYQILLDFCISDNIGNQLAVVELLMFDLYLRENLKSRPLFAKDNTLWKEQYRSIYANEELLRKHLTGYVDYSSKFMSRVTHMEAFVIDIIETAKTGNTILRDNFILFDYKNRDPLNHDANIVVFDQEELN